MTGTRFLVRFFRAVPPVPTLMHLAFAGSVVAAAIALGLGAADHRAVLAPIFLLQALAAASGYAVPARRGHYDLLLTRGVSRVAVGLAHFAASIGPGLFYWLLVAAVEAAAAAGFPTVSLATGTVAAFFIVSAVSWAVTVPLPRMTGGILWLLIVAAPVDHRAMPPMASAVLWPWGLVGRAAVAGGGLALMVAAGVAIMAMVCALAWIARTDVSLQVAR